MKALGVTSPVHLAKLMAATRKLRESLSSEA